MNPYPPPEYRPEDYRAQFQQLLPRGRVWHRGIGLVEDADLLTLMPLWTRLQARLNQLIGEIFPCTTGELLPEWEATLGLPDPCTGPVSMQSQRVAAVCSKFAARGGQSRDYFIRVAAELGFEIRIEEYSPFYASQNKAGDPVYDEKWAYAWKVVSHSMPVIYFHAGISTAGDPLAWWGNKLLECVIEALKPAHTEIVFSYTLGSSIWDAGDSIWDTGFSIWDEGIAINV